MKQPLLGRTEKCRTRFERPAPEWMPVYRLALNDQRISGTRSATDRYPTVYARRNASHAMSSLSGSVSQIVTVRT